MSELILGITAGLILASTKMYWGVEYIPLFIIYVTGFLWGVLNGPKR